MLVAICSIVSTKTSLPIVYVYKISESRCLRELIPRYILYVLEQAVMSQPDCLIVMASNFNDCPAANATVSAIPGVRLIDTTSIASSRTMEFNQTSWNILPSDSRDELFITSALRFFTLQDVMAKLGVDEMLHAEADNMLYGNIAALLPSLRKGYNDSLAGRSGSL